MRPRTFALGIGGFLAICTIIGMLMLQRTAYANFPPTAQGDWVAFGDSLTAGLGAAEGRDYPSQLSEIIGVRIRNFGVSGDTTRDGLNRIDAALKLKPRVVLLCLGGNDGLQGLPAKQAFDNLSRIIDQFHEVGSFVVLIGIRSATLQDTNETSFRELAKEKDVLYIPDILRGVFGKSALMSDYVHPNELGYEAIAKRIARELKPVLDDL